MTTSELASFYKISPQAVNKWSAKKRHQKTIQALAGAEPEVVALIGEINQLAYVFDCQNLQGVQQVKWCWINRASFNLCMTVFCGDHVELTADINLHAPDSSVRLLLLKNKLVEMVYGAQKID